MNETLLKTKFYIPPVSANAVQREHLIELLNQAEAGKLTLVSAPAGFGKTTLVSMWSRQLAHPVTWLSLDEQDNDLARFFAYLLTSFQRLDENIAVEILDDPNSRQSNAYEAILTDLLNELSVIKEKWVVILDDYHLIQTQAIHDAMIFFLDHLPPQLHLVILSRADPPFPLPRLRSRGYLVELRQKELRFTSNETAVYLNESLGLELSARDIEALEDRTEGWIAGLHMAAISLGGHRQDDVSKAAFIRAFTGSHRYVLDYLVEEVLEQQSPSIQSFLLNTSPLKRMSGPLCDWILENLEPSIPQDKGRKNSQEILEDLEAANLFIIPIDDERRWFRYHRLFGDLLKQRLQHKKPSALPYLHSRASEWFHKNGFIPEAIDHAIEADEFMRAAELILEVAEKTLMRSEVLTLLRWIESLPVEVSSQSPSLCVYHAWALLFSGYSLEAIEGCLQTLNMDAAPVSGEIAGLQALLALFQGNISRVGELSEIALEKLAPEHAYLRGFAQWLSGLARLLSGEWEAGHQDLDQLVRLSKATGNVMLAVMVMCNLAEIFVIQGKLHKASATYHQALRIAVDKQGKPLPIAGEAWIGLGEIHREWNDLEIAENSLLRGIEESQKWSETGIFEGYIFLAYVKFAQGDQEGTRQALDEAWRLARQFDATELDDQFVAAHEAHFWLLQGNRIAAERWAAEQGLSVENCRKELTARLDLATPVSHRRRTQEHISFVRLLYQQGRYKEAISILELLLEISRRWNLVGREIKLDILKAIILQELGKQTEALNLLGKALSMAEAEGFKRVFLDEGEAIVDLLQLAISTDQEANYAKSLLIVPSTTKTLDKGIPEGVIEPLSERELEVLRYLGAGLSNPEIAAELVIAVSTVRSHCKNIYGKLDVHSRLAAVQRAKKLGYL